MEIMQFKFVYLTYSESLSREKFFCGRTKYEKDAFRLESRDDSLETLLNAHVYGRVAQGV